MGQTGLLLVEVECVAQGRGEWSLLFRKQKPDLAADVASPERQDVVKGHDTVGVETVSSPNWELGRQTFRP